MKYLKILLIGYVAILTSCGERPVYETGPVITTDALIYDSAYVPEGHGSRVVHGYDIDGDPTWSRVSITIPERFSVVLKWGNNCTTILTDSPLATRTYKKFQRGEKVRFQYVEKFLVEKDKSGAEEVIVKRLIQYVPVDVK